MIELNKDVASDLFYLYAGEMIGEGQYRTVYQSRIDKRQVIKYDNRTNWSNVQEFALWQEVAGTPLAKWFAPCFWLSPAGFWLVQAKTTRIPIGKFPKRVPSIFCDLKDTNWGVYKGQPVCHDYGNNCVHSLAREVGKKLVSATWEHYL